jgi:hypothetical protein
MRNEVVASLLVVAILAGAAAGCFIGTNFPRAVQTTTITSTMVQPCADQAVWNVNSTSSLVPVLLMKPNTTAYACVTYQTWWKGNPNYNFTGSGWPFGTFQFYSFDVANEQCTSANGCNPSVSHAFRISVFPTSVNLTVFTDYVSVLYTITSLSNSTGYYSNSVPYGYCTSMPMAVGHPASDVNGSDFGPLLYPNCLGPSLSPISVSVSGMEVIYLKPW